VVKEYFCLISYVRGHTHEKQGHRHGLTEKSTRYIVESPGSDGGLSLRVGPLIARVRKSVKWKMADKTVKEKDKYVASAMRLSRYQHVREGKT